MLDAAYILEAARVHRTLARGIIFTEIHYWGTLNGCGQYAEYKATDSWMTCAGWGNSGDEDNLVLRLSHHLHRAQAFHCLDTCCVAAALLSTPKR